MIWAFILIWYSLQLKLGRAGLSWRCTVSHADDREFIAYSAPGTKRREMCQTKRHRCPKASLPGRMLDKSYQQPIRRSLGELKGVLRQVASHEVLFKNWPSEFCSWKATCWHMKVAQLSVFPPPVSVLIAWRPFSRSQVERGCQALSILLVTHSEFVPELSLSRYLCTSKMRPVMLPSGLVTLLSAAAEPFETNVSAEVQLFPGRRMSCEVAPALRIAVTAAWTESAQASMSGISWGSFILFRKHQQRVRNGNQTATYTPNRIRGSSLYLAAMLPHRAAKISLLGPPCPMIWNWQVNFQFGRRNKLVVLPTSPLKRA